MTARRIAALRIVALGLIALGAAAGWGHPGQNVSLSIEIRDDAVRYEILLSADYFNILMNERGVAYGFRLKDRQFTFQTPEQAAAAQAAVGGLFEEVNSLTIDGGVIPPRIEELALVPASAYVGVGVDYEVPPDVRVVLNFPTQGVPKRVEMIWDLFPQDPTRVAFGLDPSIEVVAELDAYHENRLIMFSAEEPEYIWHAPQQAADPGVSPVVAAVAPARIALPAVTVGCGAAGLAVLLVLAFARVSARARRIGGLLVVGLALGAAATARVALIDVPVPWGSRAILPNSEEAREIFMTLHRNVYRAFDFKSENDIYDVLAQSVAGVLLDRVYNEVYQSLILRDAGGAVQRVKSVDVLQAEVEQTGQVGDAPAFQVHSRWRVNGAVYHWGHVHARSNEYEARYTIAQLDDRWKITGVEVLAQQRVPVPGDVPLEPAAQMPAEPS